MSERINGDSIHTYPADEEFAEHITEGLMCWCVPRFYIPCDECGDLDGLSDLAEQHGVERLHSYPDEMHADVPGCWKCKEGLVELTTAEAELCTQPLVIVHNR